LALDGTQCSSIKKGLTRLEGGLVELGAAADDVARPAGGLDNEALVVQLLEHVTDDLAHTLSAVCECVRINNGAMLLDLKELQ
jgi:hypothetical protein